MYLISLYPFNKSFFLSFLSPFRFYLFLFLFQLFPISYVFPTINWNLFHIFFICFIVSPIHFILFRILFSSLVYLFYGTTFFSLKCHFESLYYRINSHFSPNCKFHFLFFPISLSCTFLLKYISRFLIFIAFLSRDTRCPNMASHCTIRHPRKAYGVMMNWPSFIANQSTANVGLFLPVLRKLTSSKEIPNHFRSHQLT